MFVFPLCLIQTVGRSCSVKGWPRHRFSSLPNNLGPFWGQLCWCRVCSAEALLVLTKHRWALLSLCPRAWSSSWRKALPAKEWLCQGHVPCAGGWRWHGSAGHHHLSPCLTSTAVPVPLTAEACLWDLRFFSGVITAFQANIFLNVTRKLLIPYGKALCIFAGQQTNCC